MSWKRNLSIPALKMKRLWLQSKVASPPHQTPSLGSPTAACSPRQGPVASIFLFFWLHLFIHVALAGESSLLCLVVLCVFVCLFSLLWKCTWVIRQWMKLRKTLKIRSELVEEVGGKQDFKMWLVPEHCDCGLLGTGWNLHMLWQYWLAPAAYARGFNDTDQSHLQNTWLMSPPATIVFWHYKISHGLSFCCRKSPNMLFLGGGGGHAHGMWKFSGQGVNLRHSSNLSHRSDKARSLACFATAELCIFLRSALGLDRLQLLEHLLHERVR